MYVYLFGAKMAKMNFIRIVERINESTTLYQDEEILLNYVNNTYITTGKCLKWREKIELSTNTFLIVSTWMNNDCLKEALIDPVINDHFIKMKEYNQNNNIVIINQYVENAY